MNDHTPERAIQDDAILQDVFLSRKQLLVDDELAGEAELLKHDLRHLKRDFVKLKDEHEIRAMAARIRRVYRLLKDISIGWHDPQVDRLNADTVQCFPHERRTAIIERVIRIGDITRRNPRMEAPGDDQGAG